MAQSRYSGGVRKVTDEYSRNKTGARQSSIRSERPSRYIQPVSERTRIGSSRASSGNRGKTSKSYERKKDTVVKKNTVKSNTAAAAKKSIIGKLSGAGEMDYTMLFLVILIVAIGLIVMLSASAPSGNREEGNSYYYFTRQLIFIIMGFIGMFIVSRMDLNKLLPLIPKAFIICVILLVLVLLPGTGVEAKGARRWLNIPFFQPQPSEFMKPIIAMYIAYLVHIKLIDLKKLKSNMVCLGIIGLVALLLMLETHLSGTIVIVGIAGCVMIAGGTPIKPTLLIGAAMVVLLFIYLQFDPVRMQRITSFLDPFADAQGSGYQITQSIYAIGSGKLFGLGLGQSVQKYSSLPEAYNDFIFSIVCEELGFFGGVIVILLFAALFLRAMKIALSAPDVWSSLTCIGIAAQLGIQTFLNMGVAVSLIPNTGVSLPFFSYGGTSIMTLLLEMGILLNVSRKSVKK